MIKFISIDNFKSFKKDSINLSNLTILTGLNSTGKSTVIQALRMVLLAKNGGSPYIKGYGGYGELRSKSSVVNDIIKLDIGLIPDKNITLELGRESHEIASDIESRCNYDYISADRLGPSSVLPILPSDSEDISVGDKGEFCVDYFLNFENVMINDKLLHPETTSKTLAHQLNKWMGEISPGTMLSFTKEEKHDLSHIEIDEFRSSNTGFGISYSLPIVLAALVMSSKDSVVEIQNPVAKKWFEANRNQVPVLMVENPEAHLHPQGQTTMGKLLALVSSCGVQVIIETHSDHFLDGIRIQTKLGDVPFDKTNIYYFEKGVNSETKKTLVELGSDGKITNWPKGFFDQMMINLRELSR